MSRVVSFLFFASYLTHMDDNVCKKGNVKPIKPYYKIFFIPRIRLFLIVYSLLYVTCSISDLLYSEVNTSRLKICFHSVLYFSLLCDKLCYHGSRTYTPVSLVRSDRVCKTEVSEGCVQHDCIYLWVWYDLRERQFTME